MMSYEIALPWKTAIAVFVVALFLLLSPFTAHAVEPVAIPSFTVSDMDGASVQSGQLTSDAKWVIVYLAGDCKHCNNLLKTLEVFKDPALSNRVVVIVGGSSTDGIQSMIGPREKLMSLRWYSDPDWQAYSALAISGTPLVLGIQRGIIEWTMAGTPWDLETTRSVLMNWVR